MKNTQHRTPLNNCSLIHMHHYHLKTTHSVKDFYNLSKIAMVETCKWISHSSPSCLRPCATTSQTFFPSFLPSCNKHSHNTTNPQEAIHPTLPGKKQSCVFPTRRRPRIQGQVTSRDLVSGGGPGEDPPESFSAPLDRQTDRSCPCVSVCVCVCVCVCMCVCVHACVCV